MVLPRHDSAIVATKHAFRKAGIAFHCGITRIIPGANAFDADGGEGDHYMRFLASFFRLGAAVLLFGVLLSACVVEEVSGPGPGPGRPFPPERPEFCSREYDPVCARRGGDRQTFPNACQAEARGYRVVSDGECRRGGGSDEPRFCTREYAPVCGRRGGNVRTFGNSCEAENAGYRIISDGECRGAAGGGGGMNEPRFCTREYAPVCGRRGGNVRTFGNSCEADNAGYRVISDGPC
jgi:hypothetical protein